MKFQNVVWADWSLYAARFNRGRYFGQIQLWKTLYVILQQIQSPAWCFVIRVAQAGLKQMTHHFMNAAKRRYWSSHSSVRGWRTEELEIEWSASGRSQSSRSSTAQLLISDKVVVWVIHTPCWMVCKESKQDRSIWVFLETVLHGFRYNQCCTIPQTDVLFRSDIVLDQRPRIWLCPGDTHASEIPVQTRTPCPLLSALKELSYMMLIEIWSRQSK